MMPPLAASIAYPHFILKPPPPPPSLPPFTRVGIFSAGDKYSKEGTLQERLPRELDASLPDHYQEFPVNLNHQGEISPREAVVGTQCGTEASRSKKLNCTSHQAIHHRHPILQGIRIGGGWNGLLRQIPKLSHSAA